MNNNSNLEQLGSSDRWFYNAVLTNKQAGDVTPVMARFLEQRTVPLIGNCAEYYVTLARLSVSGPTRNFPILAPALAQLTVPGTAPLLYTDYYVGVRYTLFIQEPDPSNGGPSTPNTKFTPIGYTGINLAQLILPCENVTGDYSSPQGDFYQVYSVHAVLDALNAAMTQATSVWGVGNPANPEAIDMAFTFLTGYTGTPQPPTNFAPFLGCDSDQSLLPLMQARMDSSFNMTLRAPLFTAVTSPTPGTDNVYCPFMGPQIQQTSNNPTSYDPRPPGAVYYQAHLYFSDKLMEILPMPTVPPYASAAALPLTPNPFQQRAAQGVDPLLYTQIGQYAPQPWVDYAVVNATQNLPLRLSSQMFGMYPLATYNVRATFVTEDARPTSTLAVTFRANNVAALPTTYAEWPQEYSTQATWTVYDGLAITSNTLPAYEEAFGVNEITAQGTPQSATADTSNIIFDLDLSQDNLHQIQSGLYFVPAAFRYAKMKPGALSNIDLQVWLRRRDGSFVPWMVDAGGTISLKLMFTKTPY